MLGGLVGLAKFPEIVQIAHAMMVFLATILGDCHGPILHATLNLGRKDFDDVDVGEEVPKLFPLVGIGICCRVLVNGVVTLLEENVVLLFGRLLVKFFKQLELRVRVFWWKRNC